jgi:hypothetical protein
MIKRLGFKLDGFNNSINVQRGQNFRPQLQANALLAKILVRGLSLGPMENLY